MGIKLQIINVFVSFLKMPSIFNGFSSKEVQKLTKVSVRRFRWWEEKGLFRSQGNLVKRPWARKFYTLEDIVCILVIKNLRDRGISIQRIRETVGRIKAKGVKNPIASLRVACLAQSIIFKKDGKYIDPISGQFAIAEALEFIRPLIEIREMANIENTITKAHVYYEKKIAQL